MKVCLWNLRLWLRANSIWLKRGSRHRLNSQCQRLKALVWRSAAKVKFALRSGGGHSRFQNWFFFFIYKYTNTLVYSKALWRLFLWILINYYYCNTFSKRHKKQALGKEMTPCIKPTLHTVGNLYNWSLGISAHNLNTKRKWSPRGLCAVSSGLCAQAEEPGSWANVLPALCGVLLIDKHDLHWLL